MAREKRREPSELAGIECEFCAFRFDEALLSREGAQRAIEMDKMQASTDTAGHRAKVNAMVAGAA